MQNFLSEGTPGYLNHTGITDVATIISDMTTLATGITPAWAQSGGGASPTTLTSPADSAGRSFSVVLTRTSATVLQALFTDGQGRTLTLKMNISGSGDSIFYYVSQYRIWIDAFVSSASEFLCGVMLDESPELQTSHNRWLALAASRNSADSSLTDKLGNTYIVDSSGSFTQKPASLLYPQAAKRTASAPSDGATCTRTLGGSNVFYPCVQMGDSSSGIYKIFGKFYGCLLASGNRFAANAEVTVPLDDSTTGVFKFVQRAFASSDQTRLCIRKS